MYQKILIPLDGSELTECASHLTSGTITDYAQENGVDLIALATHGYRDMKKMMMGSTALKVLHESNVPVLLVRPEACQV